MGSARCQTIKKPSSNIDNNYICCYHIRMFGGLLKGLVDLVYPRICLSCKEKLRQRQRERLVCDKCLNGIKKNVPPFCQACGRQLERKSGLKNICRDCARKRLAFDRAFSPCVYEGLTRQLLHKFKYQGKEHLGFALSQIMVDFIKEYSLPMDFIDLLIPVPLHKSRLREREFNQALVLARHIACAFNKPVLENCLKRGRHTRKQADLEMDERFANVAGSFRVAEESPIKGKNLLLIDDILTTGATASEAAAALKGAGANIVFVLTLAS